MNTEGVVIKSLPKIRRLNLLSKYRQINCSFMNTNGNTDASPTKNSKTTIFDGDYDKHL